MAERCYWPLVFSVSLAVVTLAACLLLLSSGAELSVPQIALAQGSTAR